jgi:hypothetical protein
MGLDGDSMAKQIVHMMMCTNTTNSTQRFGGHSVGSPFSRGLVLEFGNDLHIQTHRSHRQRFEDAVQEALSLWEERERKREEILAAVDSAEASLARCEGRVISEESMRKLAEDVKQRGRARLGAGQAPTLV